MRRMEESENTTPLSTDEKLRVLEKICAAELFERFLHTKFVGQKRFSLEGAEALIPLLDTIVEDAPEHHVRELVIGMAHRGRLNVLVNVLGKSPSDLFSEFEGAYDLARLKGSGDVKYHKGYSADVRTPGGNVHIALAFNPSHLEIVNPVVEGSVRARQDRRGIGVVPPVDPNNQDTSVLIGSEDISKLDLHSEGDPRVLDLNGAFNVGNRGMVEFIEVFKNEAEYLHTMITATQEKFVPAPGRHGTVYVDTVIVAHSNEAEWQKFKADHTNEAILDRIVVIKVPYNLRLSEEVKIYGKIIRFSDFKAHVAPHTLEVASMFAILTRLEPTSKCDLMTKLKLYNGEEVIEKGRTKKIDVRELREDVKREGMNGISTRFIMKALDNALSDNTAGNCINPINVREALINMVKEADLADDTRKQYLEFLQDTLHKEYLELLEKEITRAFVYSYQEQAEALFQNYLDHAEAYVNKSKVKDRNTKEELAPDEGFMKSIEEQIAIIGSAADGFRQEVIAYLWAANRRGEKIDYRSYEPLKEAIEKKLVTSVRDLSRVITKARMRDEEQSEKYNAMVKNLLENGYCASCVDVVLKYAANNLWKD